MAVLIQNRKARYDYNFLETFQAGLSLSGKMVKAIRAKKLKLEGLFVVYQNNRLEIIGVQIGELTENIPLLLSKKEKDKIADKIAEKGISCVVLDIKTVGRWLKAEIAVVKGKTTVDKRETIKKRDLDREARRGLIDR